MLSFGDVVIDPDNYELSRAGDVVAVEPQVFEVLCYLIEHRDRVVGKDELFDNVWGDRFVSESALSSRIKSARQAVGDDGRRQEIIRTTHGRGYRFIAEVTEVTEATPVARVGEASPGQAEASGADDTVIVLDQVESPQPRNVPAPARPLVARDRELAALVELLDANRLVTVVGPGGVGKTRLTTEVATRWHHRSDDPVVFVGLATISDADEVFLAVRDALGIRSGGSVDAFGAVAEALTGTSTLLVLDNFEHVVEAATALADLVESVPGARALVTSRERLGLAGEQVFELEPFSLAADGPAGSSAVTFFEHAVRGVRSDVDLDTDHRDDVTAICQALDGLPLAIELAAAQTRYFSVSYLRSHLESAAITVADHARDRPERHQTMQSTIAWSYRLLTSSQQKLLASLSVYKGGWALGAADAIAGSEQPGAAAHDLMALVDKSLVQRSDGVLGEPRFSMLHLLRDFAGAQLDAFGARDRTLERHASFVSETLQSLESRRWSGAADGWIDAIGAEYADAVAALSWCFTGGDPAVGCQIVRSLGFWWYRSGRHGEGRVWVDKALTNTSATDDSTTAWIHSAAGKLAKYELRPDESRQHFDLALALAREVGDERLEALCLCDIGEATAGSPEEYETGLASVQLGLEQARRLGTAELVSYGLTVLGELTRANGRPDEAEAAYREALELHAEVGDRYYEAVNSLNLGHALMAQDRMEEALFYHRRGIEFATRLGSRLMMAWNLSSLARAHHLLGKPQLAAQVTGVAEATLETLGATHGPVDQPVQDHRQQLLREDLGDEAYERLIGEGRQMRLETGIELALDALEPVSTS